VADLRASTPTDAAKRIVPDVAEQQALVAQLRDRARRCVAGWLDRELSWLQAVRSRPALADPVREIERQAEQVEGLVRRARQSLDGSLTRAADDITHTRARLLALSPAATLGRGYAIVQHADSAVVRAAAEVTPGERLTVRFAADHLTVTAAKPAKSASGTRTAGKSARPAKSAATTTSAPSGAGSGDGDHE